VDDQGRNVFDETHARGRPLLGHAIAGLQATTYDAMAIFAPNLNAYRRFAPNQFVPVNTSWGINNRSVSPSACRMGGGQARRIEHRIAGAEANPYLVMAAVLAGFHHGLLHRLEPTPPSTGNAGEEADPRDAAEALDRAGSAGGLIAPGRIPRPALPGRLCGHQARRSSRPSWPMSCPANMTGISEMRR
jgi:glutamine synthetase